MSRVLLNALVPEQVVAACLALPLLPVLDVLMFFTIFDELVAERIQSCGSTGRQWCRALLAYRATRTIVESTSESLPQVP